MSFSDTYINGLHLYAQDEPIGCWNSAYKVELAYFPPEGKVVGICTDPSQNLCASTDMNGRDITELNKECKPNLTEPISCLEFPDNKHIYMCGSDASVLSRIEKNARVNGFEFQKGPPLEPNNSQNSRISQDTKITQTSQSSTSSSLSMEALAVIGSLIFILLVIFVVIMVVIFKKEKPDLSKFIRRR